MDQDFKITPGPRKLKRSSGPNQNDVEPKAKRRKDFSPNEENQRASGSKIKEKLRREKVSKSTKQSNRTSTSKICGDPQDPTTSKATAKAKKFSEEKKISPSRLSIACDVSRSCAESVIRLLEEGNSIPFIARYRKEATGGLAPDKLREMAQTYTEIRELEAKKESLGEKARKENKYTSEFARSLENVTTAEELDILKAIVKPSTSKSLASRAREAGLEEVAAKMLDGRRVDLEMLVNVKKEGLREVKEILSGIGHIVADVISHSSEVMEKLGEWEACVEAFVECKKRAQPSKSEPTNPADLEKFKDYLTFKSSVKALKSYQILAINRGEKLKVLSVKVTLSSKMESSFTKVCRDRWLHVGPPWEPRTSVISNAVTDAYKRLILPRLERRIRSRLTRMAEKTQMSNFSANLRNLLFLPPFKGSAVMAIDPGFKNGCKIAVISSLGAVISAYTVYPLNKGDAFSLPPNERNKLIDLVNSNNVKAIAIGDGSGCRHAEMMISGLIESRAFGSQVAYTFIREAGASIYSCSPEAAVEFPGMDPNLISAVSLARRLQDPMSEFVKVEPRHLGIGMYQHDASDAKMRDALDDVVVECVSFAGVDLNYAPVHILSKVAGLNKVTARSIVEFREKKGAFANRQQLREVKGIGPVAFQQCAGFLRIGAAPASIVTQTKELEQLDRLLIHPESYKLAEKILKEQHFTKGSLGEPVLIQHFTKLRTIPDSSRDLAAKFDSDAPTVTLILEAFSQALDLDVRLKEGSKPVFYRSARSEFDLRVDQIVKGVVSNVTQFGAFVDIGVKTSGLIHTSKMRGRQLSLGQIVKVRIINLELSGQRKRIGLSLEEVGGG